MLIYNLVIRSYALAIFLSSLKNTKARLWRSGRKNWRQRYEKQVTTLGPGKRIWVHCASYGEFEQGRPVIEGLLNKYPGCRIILSFFSPSGYESFHDYKGAAMVVYLPLDTKQNAEDFIGIIKPDVAIFIKYEFWVNLLNVIRQRKIPAYLVSAVFKPHHPFFRPYGSIFRRSLRTFSKMLVQDEGSVQLLKKIGVTNCEICGDTRFDRVLEIRNKFTGVNGITEFKGASKLLVAGSTWPKDEELIIEVMKKEPGFKLLLAPHHIDAAFIKETCTRLKKHGVSYSVFTKGVDAGSRVLVLDTMGMLSRVYHYADFAYVGGGFNTGLHNVLEAAVYGIPVIFSGTEYNRYNEAVDLLNMHAASNVNNEHELRKAIVQYLGSIDENRSIKNLLQNYFEKNSDVTARVLNAIKF